MSETYYEKRKARKLAEKLAIEQAAKLKDLATSILNGDEPPVEDMDDAPEVIEEIKPYETIPGTVEEKKIIPKAIDIDFGRTKATAFVLNQRLQEMYTILGNIFGSKSGDYFIGSENSVTITNLGIRKRYKCISIEDKNGFHYVLWFDVTNLGMIY